MRKPEKANCSIKRDGRSRYFWRDRVGDGAIVRWYLIVLSAMGKRGRFRTSSTR